MWVAGMSDRGRVFFFEKKNQKTFIPSDAMWGKVSGPTGKSFLLLFFKKEDSSLIPFERLCVFPQCSSEMVGEVGGFLDEVLGSADDFRSRVGMWVIIRSYWIGAFWIKGLGRHWCLPYITSQAKGVSAAVQ
jgi:hypothetical protein